MCAGPVKNLYEDVTGITAAKEKAQNEFLHAKAKAQAEAQQLAEEEATRVKELADKKQGIIDAAAADEANITNTLGSDLDAINQTNADLTATLIANANSASSGGGGGPSAGELAARGAANTSQGILDKQKKKKKNNLKIPYSPSKRQPNQRGPKSTKADLQIEGQTQSTGTGTNLAI